MYLSWLVWENPVAGVPVALLTGCLFFGFFRRSKSLYLSYFATACLLGLTGGLADTLFHFAAEIPRIGFFKFGFALCVVFALAKFATALAMGYNDSKAIKAVSFCYLLSLGMWALLVTGTQIIDACADSGLFYLDEGLEIFITFSGLLSIVFMDGVTLDWMLKERHSDNTALAFSMNTIAHGLLLISSLFVPFAY